MPPLLRKKLNLHLFIFGRKEHHLLGYSLSLSLNILWAGRPAGARWERGRAADAGAATANAGEGETVSRPTATTTPSIPSSLPRPLALISSSPFSAASSRSPRPPTPSSANTVHSYPPPPHPHNLAGGWLKMKWLGSDAPRSSRAAVPGTARAPPASPPPWPTHAPRQLRETHGGGDACPHQCLLRV